MEPIQPLTGWVNSSRMESAGGSGIRTGQREVNGDRRVQSGTVWHREKQAETDRFRRDQTEAAAAEPFRKKWKYHLE